MGLGYFLFIIVGRIFIGSYLASSARSFIGKRRYGKRAACDGKQESAGRAV